MRYIDYGTDGSAASLHLAQAPSPTPTAGQVLIEVHCAGVNRPDIMQRQGRYPPPPGASSILGLEVAGVIAALGEGVSDWQLGQPVCALVPGGGYADYCVAPAGQVLPMPSGFDMAQAAGLPEVWFTVWANLVQLARLDAGERLLVHGGSSGIGLAAIQLARELGAEAVVTVGSQEKAQFCVAFGARAAIDYRQEDFAAAIEQLYGGEGVDVVLDMIGAAYLARNLRVLRRDGRLVLIALQQGGRGELDLRDILARRLHLTGSTMRPRSIAEKTAIRDALRGRIWPALADGRVRSHVHAIFPMDEARQAHELMERSGHIGKLVLRMRS
ncbi:MAG TPA: NAD(P)H-quinone oxidoreductase [Steroidobacteraceae bacterium]|jgi:putative PIG3 family NAD(P)H quinone oxidoreductase|nr:NAD(P)H-quinone oxidoreductase [Steroidobacteraceae bacterium]